MPNRFQFRLERLLRLRELTEEMRLRKLSLAIAATGEAGRARDERVEMEIGAEKTLAGYCVEGPLDLEGLLDSWRSLEGARRMTSKAGRDLAAKVQEEGVARESYAAAGRDRTVLSHYRERKELEHMREYDRWEQKLLDEAGARRR